MSDEVNVVTSHIGARNSWSFFTALCLAFFDHVARHGHLAYFQRIISARSEILFASREEATAQGRRFVFREGTDRVIIVTEAFFKVIRSLGFQKLCVQTRRV